MRFLEHGWDQLKPAAKTITLICMYNVTNTAVGIVVEGEAD